MSKLDTLLLDGLRSELVLKQHLKDLRETLRKQLQETETRQTEELERRIHQNALLSTDEHQESGRVKHAGMRRSISTSALNSDKHISHRLRQAGKPNSPSSAWVSSTNWKHCSVRASTLAPAKTQQCERVALSKTTRMCKEEEAVAECRKKFCALPVPAHVTQSLYRDMTELRDKERRQAREERKSFLFSIQKPFSFHERIGEKREKLIAMVNQVSQDQESKVPTISKPSRKLEKDSLNSELADKEGVCRTARIVRQEKPTVSCSPKLCTAGRTRNERLGFLDEKPTFQPKIIQQVPNFSRLHRLLQTEALRKTQGKDVTRCRPFCLRTSALPERQKRMSPAKSQEPTISHLSRSKSLGALTSLSTDTLPTYITDAVRKRSMAIRKSLEMKDFKNQESAEWLRNHQMRSQAMKKKVALHAKFLDPHSSLKEVFDEKLQQHTLADQQRMKEYKKELQDMKARVSERPYLFEQVKQKNAKALAERSYRNKLKNAGLKEQFVEEKGAAIEGTSGSSVSADGDDVNGRSSENDIPNRDDGEKIEDVEEESVKSKGEETP